MDMNNLVQTVIKFVKDDPGPGPGPGPEPGPIPVPDPEPGSNPAQDILSAITGDSLWIVIASLVVLALVSFAIFYVIKHKDTIIENFSSGLIMSRTLKDTKLLYAIAIVLVSMICISAISIKAISAHAAEDTKAYDVETPTEITAVISEDEGIVFENLDGENTSYVKNVGTDQLNYTYTKIDTSLEGLEDVVWTITVGDTEYNLPAGKSLMFNTLVDSGETLPVNIETNMSTEQALSLVDKDVLTITYGIVHKEAMIGPHIQYFVESAKSCVNEGRQTLDEIKDLYDDNFVKDMHRSTYNSWTRALNAGLGFYTIAELMSPEVVAGGTLNENGKLRAIDQFDASQDGGNPNLLEEEWNAYYDAIATCNYFLALELYFAYEIDDQSEGEIYFIRSMCNYDLLRLFGNIPLVTEGALREDLPQAIPSDVMMQCISDADKAEQLLYSIGPEQASSFSQITIPAVYMLLANLYRYKNYLSPDDDNWEHVKKYAELTLGRSSLGLSTEAKDNVTAFDRKFAIPSISWGDGQKASGSSTDNLLKNYIGLDRGENNTEIILTQSVNTVDNSKPWQDNLGMKNYGVSPYAAGAGYLMVNNKYLETTLTDWGPLEDNCAEDIGDDRGYERTTLYIGGCKDKQTNVMIAPNDKLLNSWGGYTGYIPLKYAPICTTSSTAPAYYPNLTIFSLNQAYLLKVEAMCNLGDQSDAMHIINNLVRRANATEYTSPLTLEEFYKENLKELMYEGTNYWDCLMTFGLEKTAEIIAETENRTYRNGDSIEIDKFNIIQKRGVMQIPQSILDTHVNMIQNPGW